MKHLLEELFFEDDWIRFLLKNERDDTLFDTNLLGFIIWSCLNLNAVNLLPLIKQLYDQNLLPLTMLGTFEEVERDMLQKSFLPKEGPFDIYNHYEKIYTNPLYRSDEPELPPEPPRPASSITRFFPVEGIIQNLL